ncbi:MAG: S8 family serine peptidase [bacterium]|nr:S8 family serine peptidase [bacterium]
MGKTATVKVIIGMVACLMVWGCSDNPTSIADKTAPQSASLVALQTDNIIPGQYVVVLKESGALAAKSSATYDQAEAYARSKASAVMQDNGISSVKIRVAYGTALLGFAANLTEKEVADLKADKRVSYVEADRMITVKITAKPAPVQPTQTVPYGIVRVGHASGIGKTAWILDTGIDLDHPDLTVNTALQKNFIDPAATADDDNGHGSHCAGIVAAKDNTIGVIGVASGATVVPVKVLDRRGSGAYSVIIAGVDYVASVGSAGNSANMSLTGPVYQALDDAVLAASNKGIYFALAAGNDSDPASLYSPARVNGAYIWTLSAMDATDTWASFSNYGNPPVDYCEPGVSILSCYKDGGYTTMSGTSMASPHMCGILLITGGHPATSGYVKSDPDGTADPIGHI